MVLGIVGAVMVTQRFWREVLDVADCPAPLNDAQNLASSEGHRTRTLVPDFHSRIQSSPLKGPCWVSGGMFLLRKRLLNAHRKHGKIEGSYRPYR